MGGFNVESGKGCIKLFKIFKVKSKDVFKIRELEDIKTKQSFNGPINSIVQTYNSHKII